MSNISGNKAFCEANASCLKLTPLEKAVPVNWCYLFEVWIYCGLFFAKRKKSQIQAELSVRFFLNVYFLHRYTPAPSWRTAFSLISYVLISLITYVLISLIT